MRYVLLRDDDTNALTPVECLERLYRPFLDRGLPVNLAAIPKVRTDVAGTHGLLEGYLFGKDDMGVLFGPEDASSATSAGEFPSSSPTSGQRTGALGMSVSSAPGAFESQAGRFPTPALAPSQNGKESVVSSLEVAPASARNGDELKHRLLPLTIPIGSNQRLARYLQANPGYHIAQHGYHHSLNEFASQRENDVCHRFDQGARLLMGAGFPKPRTFVAPYDKLSRIALRQAAQRFRVISTGWFELAQLPVGWWPRYALKKFCKAPHWRVGQTFLLTHPGCLLSNQRPYATMLDEVKKSVANRRLTLLVTHWWEYFRDKRPDGPFIQILHEVAAWLASQTDVKVVSFDDLAGGKVPLS